MAHVDPPFQTKTRYRIESSNSATSRRPPHWSSRMSASLSGNHRRSHYDLYDGRIIGLRFRRFSSTDITDHLNVRFICL